MESEKFHFEKREGDELVAELAELLKRKLEADPALSTDRFEHFLDLIDKLKAEKGYTDAQMRECRLYHVLAGSSESSEHILPEVDLPEGEFEAYIRNL